MKRATWIILGSVLSGVVLILFVAWSASSGVPVEVVEVTKGPIQEYVDERGKTRLPDTFVITMPYNARIAPITLTEGERVAQGDTVAQIVPDDLKLAVDQADAMVKRLDASIAENRDIQLEEIARDQAKAFVTSMDETVKAVAKQLESSKKKHEYSQKHLKRVEALYGNGNSRVLSDDEYEQAELQEVEDKLAVDQAERTYWAAVAMQLATNTMPKLIEQYIEDRKLADAVLREQREEADARRRQAKLDEQRGTLTSPVDGVVLKRCECNERALAAGTPLLEIGRLEDLEIEADILSVDVVNVKQNTPVEIYGPAIGKALPGERDYAQGTVAKVYPAGFTKISSLGVEQQRVTVIIRFHPDDLKWLREERNLGVGYRVRVRIFTDENPGALMIPRSALFRAGDGKWNVFVVRKRRARLQPVEVGIINDEHAEITTGLAEGDQIVRAPEADLTDGQRVEAVVVE